MTHALPTILPPEEPPRLLRSDAEAIEVAEELAVSFAAGADERDRERRHPVAELDRFSQSGLWALNVPKAFGGPGLSYATMARVIALIAAADGSLGQIPQNHLSILDLVRFHPDIERQRAFYRLALDGYRFGNALSERGGRHVRDTRTRIRPDGAALRIDGEKYYATGAIYAHFVTVGALDEDDRQVMAFVPRDAAGLGIVDDWDGIGQRTTGSGTVRLAGVRIEPGRVLPVWRGFAVPSVHGAVAQIIQAAIDAGLARGALEATKSFVRDFARPWTDSGQERAADDVFTLREIGRLETKLHAAMSVLEEAGRIIDAGLQDETAEAVAQASIAVAEAKVLTTAIALDAATRLFELGGTRSASRKLNHDRYWRDARTHTLHDPVRWKFRAIGDYVLNGTLPPRHAWL